MTIAYSIDGVGGTAADVAVKKLDAANWKKVSTVVDPKTGSASTVYTDVTAPQQYPRTLTLKTNVDRAGIRHSSWTFSTWSRAVDSVLGELYVKPFSTVFAMNTGGDLEGADIVEAFMNLYAFTYVSLTSKVPDSAQPLKLLFGITDILA